MSAEGFDWRHALAEMYELFRELEQARADLRVSHEVNARLRARLRQAEEAWSAYDARARAQGQLAAVDPARLRNVTITFGTAEEDAVRVPPGPGNAQFVFGLLEILLRDDRPLFFRVERKCDGDLRAVEGSEAA